MSATGQKQSEPEKAKKAPEFALNAYVPELPTLITYPELVSQLSYLSPDELEKVEQAYLFAKEKHKNQFRKSGDPYITHPVAVASICALWKLDYQAIMAALLHDVVEDQNVSLTDLTSRFGASVSEMVDGLSKLEKLQYQTQVDALGENFRKILLAMARDIRVILVKLADRLHNMRTLSVMDFKKRHRIAQETMEVYVPIAHRLGLNLLYREMQDLAFANLYPYRYAILSKAILTSRQERSDTLLRVYNAVSHALLQNNIHAQIHRREKTRYGIYRTMKKSNMSFTQVRDIFGFSIVVDSIAQCYTTLGVLHALYKPIPGHVQDHIAIPKLNRYQSLHTDLVGPGGVPIAFQIRTQEMHHVAELGVASHWLYKTENETISDLKKHSLGWFQSLLEIQQQTGNASEFMEHVKFDLFPDSVYVFTPRSQIIALPRAATALDFAYNIHSDIGDHTMAIKVNNNFVPLRTELQNGDIVEVITSPNSQPSPSWLEFVQTGKARSRIRAYLRNVNKADSIKLGKRLLQNALVAQKLSREEILPVAFDRLLNETGTKTLDDLYMDIGTGQRLAVLVSRRLAGLMEELDKKSTKSDLQKEAAKPEPVIIYGSEGITVALATCCHPIPGDTIIGELNKINGLIVHNAQCAQAKKMLAREPDKWINVDWDKNLNHKTFECDLALVTLEEKGILARVTAEISSADANITAVEMKLDGEFNHFKFTVQVENRVHLAQLIKRIRHVPGVKKIARGSVN